MNLFNLTINNKRSKSNEYLKEISKRKTLSIEELRREYEKEISGLSLYLLSEMEWCESQNIEYRTLSTSRKESATEISRNYAMELFKKVDKYKVFYEES